MAVYTVSTQVQTKDLKTTLDEIDSDGKTLVAVYMTGSNRWTIISKV